MAKDSISIQKSEIVYRLPVRALVLLGNDFNCSNRKNKEKIKAKQDRLSLPFNSPGVSSPGWTSEPGCPDLRLLFCMVKDGPLPPRFRSRVVTGGHPSV